MPLRAIIPYLKISKNSQLKGISANRIEAKDPNKVAVVVRRIGESISFIAR